MDVNIGSIWTMIVGTAAAVVYMFSNFVSFNEFNSLYVNVMYDSFYELLDQRADATEDGNEDLARELGRRMEQLKAKICKIDPDWERCNQTEELS